MKTYRALLTMLLAVALLAVALLAACGNKGDLVRPEPKGMAPAGAPAA